MDHEFAPRLSSIFDDKERVARAKQVRQRRNREGGWEFVEEMFSRRSRYLILFVTLTYKEMYQDDVTLWTIRAQRDRFFKHIENSVDSFLSGIRGCIWHLEEGTKSGGLHLHLLIFYSGEFRGDMYYAQKIGECWVNVITGGWGAYWNSNAKKDKRDYPWGVAIGQVDRGSVKQDSLREFIDNYMAKNNQVPTMRRSEHLFGIRTFNRY